MCSIAGVTRFSIFAKVSGTMVGDGGCSKLVGQFFEILGYVGYVGAQFKARAELGT